MPTRDSGLGVADALGDVPQSASELAAKTGANADALRRAMRLLAAYDVFEAEGEGQVLVCHEFSRRVDHSTGRVDVTEEMV